MSVWAMDVMNFFRLDRVRSTFKPSTSTISVHLGKYLAHYDAGPFDASTNQAERQVVRDTVSSSGILIAVAARACPLLATAGRPVSSLAKQFDLLSLHQP
jgi:hypothetical protein